MLPIAEVQAAIYTALAAALAPVPVFDQVGPHQAYPYVAIGESTSDQADTLAEEGAGIEMTIHVWSRQPGMQECQALMSAAKDALHRKRLDAGASAQWVDTIWQFGQTLRDPDGVTRHGVLRFRVEVFSRV